MSGTESSESVDGLEIAVVGMAGRFPGARDVDEFWQNLCEGVESISFFSDDELVAAGVDPALVRDPSYVKARGVLKEIDLFDASFFGFYPREAELMDPQHRLFLECAWQALEDAGYDPERYGGLIGVFAGVSMNTYLLSFLASQRGFLSSAEGYQLAIANDKDFLATRVSYKLNLKGPSVVVQTACSTSLVAIHLACQNLLGYQCDMALAGGVSIHVPEERGYSYQEGMILSPDGHCRAFDARAQGTVSGNGVGIVVLKRLSDALADGDHIYAVVKGSACNNDGSMRVGFTAPGVDGQAEVVATAQAVAGVEPETISYIETHGTGTTLGDPIEIAALTEVFREKTDAKGFCALGSVKTNIGHLDAAAGVASFIKTVLALQHKKIPPSLNFERPNPKTDLPNSPFYVNNRLQEWPAGSTPRRAGVSSFGIGGTNAHVVLEEAPEVERAESAKPWQLIVLSAKSPTALDQATDNLAVHLKRNPELGLADVAYTLQIGRKAFNHRRMVVCQTLEDAAQALESRDPKRVFSASHQQVPGNPPVVFMFSGQGSQYPNMGRDLFETEPTFREQIDLCSELFKTYVPDGLCNLLYPPVDELESATQKLNETYITQPALFAVEYALARLLMEWGIQPQAMIGHSIGEYVAACLAGVFSLEDGLRLVAIRGRMMQEMPKGAMLSVSLPEDEVRPLLNEHLSLAAINARTFSVVSGPMDAIEDLEKQLSERNTEYRRLHTSHAFHSEMMDPVLERFAGEVAKLELHEPSVPFISNVTGTWITPAEATDPGYWARHLRQTVRFADGIDELLQDESRILLEVGPGKALSTLARRAPNSLGRIILSTLPHPQERQSDVAFLLNTIGRMWLAGVEVDWQALHAGEKRRRVPLPTYPFERQRYWLELKEPLSVGAVTEPASPKKTAIDNWFYLPSWKRADLIGGSRKLEGEARWLVFLDDLGLGSRFSDRLRQEGQDVVAVKIGEQFGKVDAQTYAIDPQCREDYDRLFQELADRTWVPDVVVHLCSLTSASEKIDDVEETQGTGFYSLLFLAQALGKQHISHSLDVNIVSSQLFEVTGEEALRPEKATLLGPAKVIPQEYPNIRCRVVDIRPPEQADGKEQVVDALLAELTAALPETVVAYRGGHRWVQTFEHLPLEDDVDGRVRLQEEGVYLITGGLGRIGLALAEFLAKSVRARLVLVCRSEFPDKPAWEQWLSSHAEDDPVSRKIRKLQALEEAGGQVLVLRADVADEEQMRNVLERARERFGEVNGVIHAAGIVGEKSLRAISELSRSDSELQFHAKMRGVQTLARVLQEANLDFCILQSSLSTVLGGLGFTAYSAANHFVDAFAQEIRRRTGVPWLAIDWDGWQFEEEREPDSGLGASVAELAITPEEGIQAFRRILSLRDLSQVIVSTGDLHSRLDRWVKRESSRDQEPAEQLASSSGSHPRPNLQTSYVAPTTELERQVAEIWQQLLGIEPVGIYDNFFDLGGNSLLGTQLVSQLRSAFQVELPLRSLFEDPTVIGVAKAIEQEKQGKEGEAEKVADLLKKMEELTDEEVKAMLEEKKASS
jgi:acyl transferase domain-containing protein